MTQPASDRAGGEGSSTEVSLVAPLNLLLRRGRLLVILPIALAAIAAGYALWSQEYVARAGFVPDSPSAQRSQFAGLAMQFGIDLGGGGGRSPDFFAWLLQSPELLKEAVRAEYRFPVVVAGTDSIAGTLIELFEVEDPLPTRREAIAIERLADNLSVSVERGAGVVVLEVTSPWPVLSELVVAKLIELLNTFNVDTRSSSATARRDFAEDRMVEAAGELRAAEGNLREFLEGNRRYQDSPDLQFEYARLSREVELRQQVYVTLMQGYEQARVDAVLDTPVLTVIERPEGTAKVANRPLRSAALGFGFGLVIAIAIAVVGEYAARQRGAMPDDYREFDRLRRSWFRRRREG